MEADRKKRLTELGPEALAEEMEKAGRQLCASIILRALLNSILNRAQFKAYAHGARYLKRLDRLAKSVSNWRGFENHRDYLDNLRQQHGASATGFLATPNAWKS